MNSIKIQKQMIKTKIKYKIFMSNIKEEISILDKK